MKEGARRFDSLKSLSGGLPADCLLVPPAPHLLVTIEVRIGLLRDRVFEGSREFEVRRGRDGWRYIGDAPRGANRVRYDGWRDVLVIESSHGSFRIRIRWRNTTFAWRGRSYRIEHSFLSRVTIFQGDRPAVQGHLTWSGIRLERVDPEFRDIERELAFGLAHRATTMAMVIAAAH